MKDKLNKFVQDSIFSFVNKNIVKIMLPYDEIELTIDIISKEVLC